MERFVLAGALSLAVLALVLSVAALGVGVWEYYRMAECERAIQATFDMALDSMTRRPRSGGISID